MKGWRSDKRWSDRFLPEIKRIIGEHLISEPPIEEDTDRNTDLIVLKLDAVRIACRVRKHHYTTNYADEFTIRTSRPSGNKTELSKIIEGYGDYNLYGFCDEQEKSLCRWVLGDLRAFRVWMVRHMATNGGRLPGREKKNTDGSSSFRAFDVYNIPDFVVAEKIKGLEHE
jgi:hypothetical protein